jgi:hypothetical protein
MVEDVRRYEQGLEAIPEQALVKIAQALACEVRALRTQESP